MISKQGTKPIRWKIITASHRERAWALCLAFSFFFFQFLGMYLDYNLTIPFIQVLLSAACALIPALVCAELLLRANTFICSRSEERQLEFLKKDKYVFLITMGIIFLCWIPFFLAFYPGIMAYDVKDQIFQTAGSYITDHPLIHTLILQGFIRLGQEVLHNTNRGISFYTLIQMLITSAAFSWMLLLLYRAKVHKVIRIILLVFACIFPVWPILAMSATKDIIFADAFLLCAVCAAYWCLDHSLAAKPRFLVLFGCSLWMACMFRTGSYVIGGVTLVLGIIVFRGRSRIRVVITCAVSMLAAVGASALLTSATQATTLKSNELISVPLQQVGMAFNSHKEELTDEEKETVYSLVQFIDNYDPHTADPIKDYHINVQDDERFWNIYMDLMKRYPGDYLTAWLNNTMGMWYIWDTSSTRIYGSWVWWDGGVGYLLTDMHSEIQELEIHRNSQLPGLMQMCLDLVNNNSFLNIPVFRILFSLSFYFWLAMLAFTLAIINKRRNSLLFFLFTACYIAGLFFCPCVLVRYCFPFIICIPVMFTVAFRKGLPRR